MKLLLRRPQLATILAALLLLIALPFTWTDRAPWHGIAPALSYAGGSPDETLSPQNKRAAAIIRVVTDGSDRSTQAAPALRRTPVVHGLTRGEWLLLWSVNVKSLLRF